MRIVPDAQVFVCVRESTCVARQYTSSDASLLLLANLVNHEKYKW